MSYFSDEHWREEIDALTHQLPPDGDRGTLDPRFVEAVERYERALEAAESKAASQERRAKRWQDRANRAEERADEAWGARDSEIDEWLEERQVREYAVEWLSEMVRRHARIVEGLRSADGSGHADIARRIRADLSLTLERIRELSLNGIGHDPTTPAEVVRGEGDGGERG